MKKFKYIDLFAGLGGFHVALDRLGGQCVFAAEIDERLQSLYKTNFGVMPKGDIREVKPADIPDHDVLCAGFPCQPFSKAGEQKGFECTRQGDLFFNVVDILKKKKPGYLILENVANLLKHDGGKTYERIQSELSKLGYSIDARRFSPHQFGIPQIRERVYIVGSRAGLDAFDWPEVSNRATNIEGILDKKPADARQLSERAADCLNVWADFLACCPKDVELPSFPLWSMEFGATYPYEEQTPYALVEAKGSRALAAYKGSHGVPLRDVSPDQRMLALPSHARSEESSFPHWKVLFIRQNREFYQQNRQWIDPWLPKILKFPSSLQKFEWNIKGGERDLWQYVLQFRASGVRVKRRSTAPSLIAMTDTQVPIIGWERRYMTPRECARLQSLGNISLPESPTRAFAALGNAVNADVVQAIAAKLLMVGDTASVKIRQPQPRAVAA